MEYRAKAKVKRAEKAATDRHRINRVALDRNQLRKVNTTLRHQLFSDMAV
jgi:hypothetical protein